MPNLPTSFYAIARDGLHRIHITDEFVGPQTDLMMALAKFVPRTVRDILPSVAIAMNQTGFMLAKRLPSLDIHTFYRPMVDKAENPIMIPVWVPPGSEIKCTWNPPHKMGLYFVQRWEIKDAYSPVGVEPIHYLVARNDETRRTYLLPLPNLYEDSRVCLGRNKICPGCLSAMEIMDKSIQVLQTSNWNADLLRESNSRAVHAMFRFDGNGKQIPMEGDWTEMCPTVSSGNYEFIAKI